MEKQTENSQATSMDSFSQLELRLSASQIYYLIYKISSILNGLLERNGRTSCEVRETVKEKVAI